MPILNRTARFTRRRRCASHPLVSFYVGIFIYVCTFKHTMFHSCALVLYTCIILYARARVYIYIYSYLFIIVLLRAADFLDAKKQRAESSSSVSTCDVNEEHNIRVLERILLCARSQDAKNSVLKKKILNKKPTNFFF